MRRVLPRALGALLVALGTWAVGWTAPALWGIALGLVGRRSRRALSAAIDGTLGWAALLVLLAIRTPAEAVLASRLADTLFLPTWGLYAVTLLFPALLASSAAHLAAFLRLWRGRPRGGVREPGGIMRQAA